MLLLVLNTITYTVWHILYIVPIIVNLYNSYHAFFKLRYVEKSGAHSVTYSHTWKLPSKTTVWSVSHRTAPLEQAQVMFAQGHFSMVALSLLWMLIPLFCKPNRQLHNHHLSSETVQLSEWTKYIILNQSNGIIFNDDENVGEKEEVASMWGKMEQWFKPLLAS